MTLISRTDYDFLRDKNLREKVKREEWGRINADDGKYLKGFRHHTSTKYEYFEPSFEDKRVIAAAYFKYHTGSRFFAKVKLFTLFLLI